MTAVETHAQPQITPEQAGDAFGVEAVVNAAFGPGRFAKTAERLREGSTPMAGFVAREGGRIVGAVRLWPILIGETRAAFLGPIAVGEAHRKGGLGAQLVEACLAAADAAGLPAVLLVGDSPYFGRFGFERATDVTLPGPVDARRLLVRVLKGAAPVGTVSKASNP